MAIINQTLKLWLIEQDVLIMHINGERIQNHLKEIAKFGALAEGGTTRYTYSKEWRDALNVLKGYAAAIGMEVYTDSIGNTIFCYKGRNPELKPVMCGSHLDTVKAGGNYDGILGILSAFEVAESWYDAGFRPERSLQIIATAEEEGNSFGQACFSVAVRAGLFKNKTAAEIECRVKEGTLADRLKECGLPTDALQSAAIGFDDIHTYVELHIEQGAELDEKNIPVGAVTAIVGYDRLYITLKGEANHSGTTAMHRRKDALVGAAEIVINVNKLANKDKRFVATVGKLEVKPNMANIVPGEVSLVVETRSYTDEILKEVREYILDIINDACNNNGLTWQIDGDFHNCACELDKDIINCTMEAAKEVNIEAIELPSWAGHDAQIVSCSGVPTGMIFVKSINGISHAKEEYSTPEDILAGVRVLDKVLRKLTGK